MACVAGQRDNPANQGMRVSQGRKRRSQMKHDYDYDYDYNSPSDSDSTSRRDFLKTSLLSGAAALTALKVPLAHAQAAPTVQPPFSPIDPANSPMGTAFGVKPGRVSWAFDP